jgi:hypothetical protein
LRAHIRTGERVRRVALQERVGREGKKRGANRTGRQTKQVVQLRANRTRSALTVESHLDNEWRCYSEPLVE